jgi:hypothetical protein
VVSARGRRLAGLAIAATLATGAAACSSGSSGSPTPTPTTASTASQRAGSAAALLVQCALDQHNASLAASAAKDNKLLPPAQRWLKNRQLVLTSANAGAFNGWFQGHQAGVVVHGKSLDRWAVAAALDGKLPAAICGSGTSARQLFERVYAQFPKIRKSNPWN